MQYKDSKNTPFDLLSKILKKFRLEDWVALPNKMIIIQVENFRQIDHCALSVVVAGLVLPAPLKAQFLVARSAPATEFCLSVTNN